VSLYHLPGDRWFVTSVTKRSVAVTLFERARAREIDRRWGLALGRAMSCEGADGAPGSQS
jgi:hypothetical protein